MNKKGFLFLLLIPAQIFAWGERGHDLVAQVAVRLAQDSDRDDFFTPFYKRSLMLGHLANVPDIVWKSDEMPAEEKQLNGPTHYIGIDNVYQSANFNKIPRDIESFRNKAEQLDLDLNKEVGTAPWRVVQLFNLMKDNFTELQTISTNDVRFTDTVNKALLYGGLMAHFVGDLANPHHTSGDYDGWGTKQGGLHAYFESACVAALPFSLSQDVYDNASSQELLEKRIFSKFEESDREELSQDPAAIIFALTHDSINELPTLLQLDRDHALIKESREDRGLKIPAKRQSPQQASQKMKPLIVERLSLSASVLKHLWQLAWTQAGEPDLAGFHSWYYPVKPSFIYPDYL